MQEETFQLQQKQVIEYSLRKILKPLQRKSQHKAQDPDDFYSTLENSSEVNTIQNFSKRGTIFSIEEEYYPRIIQNPLLNELPNFSKIQYQFNHTIQQQPEVTYVHPELFQNEVSNQNCSELQQQNLKNDFIDPIEDLLGSDYKLIEVDDINYLQTFQNNILKNQTKALRDKKQTPKIIHSELTKSIHKISIKK
ncbi:unnamed protein product [Paramecium sonneborni]|uniref:Uncharacterized protein n=1 Tax=Paramecium sonneborni TaxID=65129 RepID=A0A8S1QQA5_9CILI|nr:unnamed protein product [Paramecium sonneborni]